MYVDGLNEFKSEHPDFIGSKFIFAPLKAVPEQTITEYIDIVTDLQRKFPEYIAGFDLVGQEDKSPNLVDLAENLLQIPEDIKFFYHAGETNWFGSIDENLVCNFYCWSCVRQVACHFSCINSSLMQLC